MVAGGRVAPCGAGGRRGGGQPCRTGRHNDDERGLDLKQLSAAEWDALWSEAKLNGA